MMTSTGSFLSRRKVMEWFSRKTPIAGTEIPNWMIVLGVIIMGI